MKEELEKVLEGLLEELDGVLVDRKKLRFLGYATNIVAALLICLLVFILFFTTKNIGLGAIISLLVFTIYYRLLNKIRGSIEEYIDDIMDDIFKIFLDLEMEEFEFGDEEGDTE